LESAHKNGTPFPLVLLDAVMPEVDGFHILRRIRSNPALAGAVVMLLTANRNTTDLERCRQLGVKQCLTKPIGQSELLDAILSALGHDYAEKQLVDASVSAQQKPSSQPLNTLLCEDNAVNQKLAIRLLEKAGHRVVLACTGLEAISALENASRAGFDLVLMDIQMPEMDGMEATAAIRALEMKSGGHIPILAMTAHAMRGDREKYIASGMDGYISKPIQPTTLFGEIDRCLGLQKGRATMADNSVETTEQVDLVSLLQRVEGDKELLAEMVQVFLEDLLNLLNTMRDALQHGDMVVLERSAHSLKGAAGNLSAKQAADAAMKLEKDAKNNDAESARESLAGVERVMKIVVPALSALCQGVSK
jgi:two-component system, sensor histidine kinase and response regulator